MSHVTTLRLSKISQLLMSRAVNRQTAMVVSGGVSVDNTVDASNEPAAFIETAKRVPAGEAADVLQRTRMDLRRQLRALERRLLRLTEPEDRLEANKQRRTLEGQLKASFEPSHKVLEPYIAEAAAAILPNETWQRILTIARMKHLEARTKPKTRGASFAPGRAQ